MRLLVTGASGFLGFRVVEQAIAAGHAVAAVRLDTPQLPDRADGVTLDLTDAAAVARLVRDARPQAIIHTAALTDPGACERDPSASHRANVEATANLLAAASRHVPGTPFLFTSTDLVFDGREGNYTEDAPVAPLSVYGRHKVEAESLVLAQPGGTVLRTSLLFGEPVGGRAGFLGWMLRTLLAGELLTLFRDEYRTPVLSTDLARALLALATRGVPGGLFHAGGPERLSRLDLGAALCRAFGFDVGLLRGVALSEQVLSPPRPADVSLNSARLGTATDWHPMRFEDFLNRHFVPAITRQDLSSPQAAT